MKLSKKQRRRWEKATSKKLAASDIMDETEVKEIEQAASEDPDVVEGLALERR